MCVLSIEAKSHNSDFLRDKKKTWRRRRNIQRMSNFAGFIFNEDMNVDLKKIPKTKALFLNRVNTAHKILQFKNNLFCRNALLSF